MAACYAKIQAQRPDGAADVGDLATKLLSQLLTAEATNYM